MSTETHDPSSSEAMAISLAGAQAASTAETPQEAEQKINQAVEEKARELKVTLDPDAAKAVGREVISQLEAMGAFQAPEPELSPEVQVQGAAITEQATVQQQVEQPPQPKKNWIQRLVSDD